MREKISDGSGSGKNFDDYLGEKNFECVKKGEICRDGVYIYRGAGVGSRHMGFGFGVCDCDSQSHNV